MEEAWDTFLMSGKITDYLRYKQEQRAQQGKEVWETGKEWPDGTNDRCDRDGVKCNASG